LTDNAVFPSLLSVSHFVIEESRRNWSAPQVKKASIEGEKVGSACRVKAFGGKFAPPAPVRFGTGYPWIGGIPRALPFEPDPLPPRLTL